MTKRIRAIETKYQGYRFRSRLEARWAVFFSALHTEWDYEPEGYDLGKAGWYLPDFWLPDMGVFVEIKASGLHDYTEVHGQMNEFRDGVGPIILAVGLPSMRYADAVLRCHDVGKNGGGTYIGNGSWDWCTRCNKLRFQVADADTSLLNGDRTLYRDSGMTEPLASLSICNSEHRRNPNVFMSPPDVHDACNAARSARFEHGETGRVLDK